jgi:hypothetical protein
MEIARSANSQARLNGGFVMIQSGTDGTVATSGPQPTNDPTSDPIFQRCDRSLLTRALAVVAADSSAVSAVGSNRHHKLDFRHLRLADDARSSSPARRSSCEERGFRQGERPPSIGAGAACASHFYAGVDTGNPSLAEGTPEVRSTAFAARPPDLPPRSLMAVDFAITCSLVPAG